MRIYLFLVFLFFSWNTVSADDANLKREEEILFSILNDGHGKRFLELVYSYEDTEHTYRDTIFLVSLLVNAEYNKKYQVIVSVLSNKYNYESWRLYHQDLQKRKKMLAMFLVYAKNFYDNAEKKFKDNFIEAKSMVLIFKDNSLLRKVPEIREKEFDSRDLKKLQENFVRHIGGFFGNVKPIVQGNLHFKDEVKPVSVFKPGLGSDKLIFQFDKEFYSCDFMNDKIVQWILQRK